MVQTGKFPFIVPYWLMVRLITETNFQHELLAYGMLTQEL